MLKISRRTRRSGTRKSSVERRIAKGGGDLLVVQPDSRLERCPAAERSMLSMQCFIKAEIYALVLNVHPSPDVLEHDLLARIGKILRVEQESEGCATVRDRSPHLGAHENIECSGKVSRLLVDIFLQREEVDQVFSGERLVLQQASRQLGKVLRYHVL